MLDGQLPVALGGDGHKRIGDLDEAAWCQLDSQGRFALRELVSKALQARLRTLPGAILQHPLPSPAVALRVLSLDSRTVTSLCRLLPIFPADRAWTVARYLTVSGFGARCLLDLLSGLEAAGGTDAVATTPQPPRGRRVDPGEERELRRALRLLRTRLPLPEDEATTVLSSLGEGGARWSIPRLLKQASAAGFDVPFRLLRDQGRTLLVAPTQITLASTTRATANQFVRHWGLASINQIVSQVRARCGQAVDSRVASVVLSSLPRFSWLDRRLGWFWFRDCPNRLVRAFGKVFSLVQRLRLVELSQAVFRAYRFRERPGRRVMESVCAQLPGCCLRGEWVTIDGVLDRAEWLSPTELSLVAILERQGGAMSLRSLRPLARERGVSSRTLEEVVRLSPVVAPRGLTTGTEPLFAMIGGASSR